MKIKYAGPRPQISQHGVSFKDGKEDKYVYLTIAIQILQAIDKDYEKKDSYSYDIKTKRLSDLEMLTIMLKYEPSLEDVANKEAAEYSIKLDQEIEDVSKNQHLSELDKSIWIKNLEIMKEYRIQRAVNKIFYMHAVSDIAKIIKEKKIKEIDTPFYEKYWHVLQTIEGQFANTKTPISTELKVETVKNGDLVAKMLINGVS
jgi:hypothetical protein